MTDVLELPQDDWTEWLADRIDSDLATAATLLDRLRDGSSRASEEVLDLWNDAEIAVDNANALAGLFAEVHPDEAVRELAEERTQRINRFVTDRDLDRALYDVVAGTDEDEDAERNKLRARVLRDFRRAGVDRDDDVRDRLRAISERLTVLDQDFARVIRDDVRSIRVMPEQLDGMPADYLAAHPAGDDGLVEITTDYPDFLPLRIFARDRQVRHDLTVEFLNRAWPQNDVVLAEMIALRNERARLVGYDSWPEFDAAVKMIGSGVAIPEFIDRVAAAADTRARADLDRLVARARQDDPSLTELSRADSMYYEELVKREDYDVDAGEVRRYFDFASVRDGLLDTTAKLFGVEYWPRDDVVTWHEDVAAYDVKRDGETIGRIYLDLHPREGKFKHAAQFVLVPGVEGRQLPEGVLACNFSRDLLEHGNVVTLFHEFGHLVHHVLAGRQRFVRFSGVATEWDFVEAPSQMLEEWAWNADILAGFARDADDKPIPRELVQRMRAANEFGKGLFVRTQLFYSAVSYRLYEQQPEDILELVKSTQAQYDVIPHLDGTHFYAGFGHLSGYSSAYYTYLWSLVIAKDLFSAFGPDNLLHPAVAHRYRDQVLAPGGSRDAADLVSAFLGRPYRFDAFAAWLATD